MSLIVKRTQLAAKAEGTEGTAETLAGADVLLVENLKFNPNPTVSKRPGLSASMSPWAAVPGARSASLEFDVEVKGSGAAGTAPALGKLLKGCGFDEEVSTGVSVAYTPASTGISSMTLAAYMDGVIKEIWGARGTVSLKMEVGKPAYLHFVFTGADFSVTDGVMLSSGISYEDTIPPAFLSASFTIDSYAALIGLLEFNMQNAIALRPDANSDSGYKSAVIATREPVLTFDPEMVTVATYDFYKELRDGTQGALTAALTGSAGNICTVTAPKVQYTGIRSEEKEGFRSLGIDCQLNRSTGDDELVLTFT